MAKHCGVVTDRSAYEIDDPLNFVEEIYCREQDWTRRIYSDEVPMAHWLVLNDEGGTRLYARPISENSILTGGEERLL